MQINGMAAGVIAAMLALLGYALWYSRQHPREIVAEGAIEVAGVRGGSTVRLKTRDIAINKVVFKEVEMPNGTWIDCGGDCAKAAREAGDGFWQNQANSKR